MLEYRDYLIEEIQYSRLQLGGGGWEVQKKKKKWSYVHKDYDGPGDLRIGYADSLEACQREIDELEPEDDDDFDDDFDANFEVPY